MEDEETITTLMSALSTLPPPQLSLLTHTLLSLSFHHHRRLFSLLSSPSAFSFTLRHLHSLSLPKKSILIANHLLFTLHHLTRHFLPPPLPPPPSSVALKHRDLDAILLLLLLCDVHQHNPHLLKTTLHSQWCDILRNRCSDAVLTHSGLGGVILPYVEVIARCRRFVGLMGGEKEITEVAAAAAPAAVVALPAVEVEKGGGGECVICREEMEEGRDVCELPCQHVFHWICVLPWLKKRNTCPCCRFQLPTEDVIGEIRRLWSVVVKAADHDVAESDGVV